MPLCDFSQSDASAPRPEPARDDCGAPSRFRRTGRMSRQICLFLETVADAAALLGVSERTVQDARAALASRDVKTMA